MIIQLISIGKGLPDWINTGFNKYAKRLSQNIQLKLIELPLPKRTKNISIEKLKSEEATLILEQIPDKQFTITLDERGKLFKTQQLAENLSKWNEQYQNISIIIGGPDGLDQKIRDRADLIWSLSPLTLPHGLVRILTAEQIYRAYSLMTGHPYHRE